MFDDIMRAANKTALGISAVKNTVQGDPSGSDVRFIGHTAEWFVRRNPNTMIRAPPVDMNVGIATQPNAATRMLRARAGLPPVQRFKGDVAMQSAADVAKLSGNSINYDVFPKASSGRKAIPGLTRFKRADGTTRFTVKLPKSSATRAFEAASKTGLVYSRPDIVDRTLFDLSGQGGVRSKELTVMLEDAKEMFRFRNRSLITQAKDAMKLRKVDKAIIAAADAGLQGTDAYNDVQRRLGKLPQKALVSERLTPEQAAKPKVSELEFFDDEVDVVKQETNISKEGSTKSGEIRNTDKPGKFGKFARGVFKFAPVTGGIIDGAEFISELREDTVEPHEVIGAGLDFVIGLTGVGNLATDGFALAAGDDGAGSTLVRGLGGLFGQDWRDRD